MSAPARIPASLSRELGLFGAVMMGLGSIVGTGVFVSIGLAAGVAGPGVIVAIAVAALLAACNALSSAQLAALHPVSGGTYEYGYLRLAPMAGFAAGWMFLCAKTASAATAALGFSGYLLHIADLEPQRWLTPLAIGAVVALTAIVASGIRRAGWANALIVSITLVALIVFVVAGLPRAVASTGDADGLTPFFAPAAGEGEGGGGMRGMLEAMALMFVAYTGYGRIATLGEEVRNPRRTIPRAIVITLAVSALLYIAVSFVAVASIGAAALSEATMSRAAPLEVAARSFDVPVVAWLVAAGAVTAMLGVLLNLILGLSRVLLAMGRRGDMPRFIARVDEARGTPVAAVIVIGGLIALLAAMGSVKAAWSFSAFTVLVYYAITNAAALRLKADERLYHPAFAWCGLAGCLGLAFWVEMRYWLAGLTLLAVGLVWHAIARRTLRASM
jgi:APA family basic amino acid/polyamine antiporter